VVLSRNVATALARLRGARARPLIAEDVASSSREVVGCAAMPTSKGKAKAKAKAKAKLTRARAAEIADQFLRANLGKNALKAPAGSKYRVGRVLDKDGVINVIFFHGGDEADPAILGHGDKCVAALKETHPEVAPFTFVVHTLRN
jgi:hypothetical protein